MDGRQLRPIDEPLTVISLRLVGGNKKECLVQRATGKPEWVGSERVRENDKLVYYKSLVPVTRPTNSLIIERFAAVDDADRNTLLRTFLTHSGLVLPASKREDIAQKLKTLKSEFDPVVDKEYVLSVAQLRKSIVIESIVDEQQRQKEELRDTVKSMVCQAESNRIRAENKVDLDGLAWFEFTDELHPMRGINLEEFAKAKGCECDDRCRTAGCACIRAANSEQTYYQNGKLSARVRVVYECNRNCKCSRKDCCNSVVTKGCPYALVLFKTFNGCGWGVRTTEEIPKGSYVLTYTGEIITAEEKERRSSIFVFALNEDETKQERCLFVDALSKGNLSRFVNHSCVPNIKVVKVFSDYADERLPMIVFFAYRTIQPGEELSINYGEAYQLERCKCGRKRCSGANGFK